jgi:hypothetical protein
MLDILPGTSQEGYEQLANNAGTYKCAGSKDSHREVVSDRFLREQDGGLGTAGLASAVVGSCASFVGRSTPLFPISTYAAHDRRLSRRA